MARILIADDDDRIRESLRDLLASEGFEVCEARDGQEAVRLVGEWSPDLVLLDVVMPRLDGLAVLRVLKSPQNKEFLPVILLTSRADGDTRLQGLRLGADDYLTKPAEAVEVLARIEALLRIKKLQDQIASSQKKMQDASLTDPLTGLYNARYMELRLKDEFKRAERYNEPLSLVLLELVDTERSMAGGTMPADDDILTEAAAVIRAGVREFDVVIYRSSFEFAVLLPRTHFAGAMAVAGRLWSELVAGRFRRPGGAKPLAVNVGVGFFPDKNVDSAVSLTHKTIEALDLARREGPGQICLLQQTAYFFRPDQGA